MNFSRYKTLRRDFGTTLLFVGLSLALSPEVRATDEFEEDINRTDLFDHSALKSELKESSVIKDTGRHGSERSDEIVDRDQMDLVDYFTGLLIGGLFGLGAGHAIHENPRAKYFFVIDAVSYSGLFFAAYSFNEDRLSDEIFKIGCRFPCYFNGSKSSGDFRPAYYTRGTGSACFSHRGIVTDIRLNACNRSRRKRISACRAVLVVSTCDRRRLLWRSQ